MNDTTEFVPDNADYFSLLVQDLKYPAIPKKPSLDRKDYKTNKAFHIAWAEVEDQYEDAKSSRKEQLDEYNRQCAEIDAKFWEWALRQCGVDKLPIEVQAALTSFGYMDGHSGGYSEMYNSLSDVADIALAAYEAGKKAVGK